MSVAHSTNQTIVIRHTNFNRLAFGIDLDGNHLPGETGCVYRGFDIISSEKYKEIMSSTSNDHPHYQRTTDPDGQTVIVSRQQSSKMDSTLRVVMKQLDCFRSIHLFILDETGRKLGQDSLFKAVSK